MKKKCQKKLVIANELMDLGIEHQWLFISQKERQPDFTCILRKEYTSTHSLAKGMEQSLIQSLNLSANLQEIQRTKSHVARCHEYAISKMQTAGMLQVECPGNEHK